MNRVALITGGSRGIGRGIALELAKLGYDLLLNYTTNQTAAEQTADACVELGTTHGHQIRAEICQADIGLDQNRRRLIDQTRALFGRLDLLVNNAGIGSIDRQDLLEATEQNFDRLMAINLKGPYFLTQLAARWMIEQVQNSPARPAPCATLIPHPPPPKPKIINISSISAYTASVNRGDYCLAKAALAMLTKLFAVRLAEHGIGVYEVRPGVIATDMTAPVRQRYDQLIAAGLTPFPRWGTPEDVGRAVAALAQDFLPFSTGEVLNVDGGFHLRIL